MKEVTRGALKNVNVLEEYKVFPTPFYANNLKKMKYAAQPITTYSAGDLVK